MWLTRDLLTPYNYWQFWRNTEDADVGGFLRLFTDLPLSEIARLEALGGAEINEAKKILATEATRLAHGADFAAEAAETARQRVRGRRGCRYAPWCRRARALSWRLAFPAFRLFAIAGLAGSNGEARRLIRGGGARINDIPIKDEGHTVTVADLHGDAIKLSAGRKHHRLVRAA